MTRRKVTTVGSSGVYVNLPFDLQDQLETLVSVTGSNKSRTTQEALRLYMNQTAEVNELTQLAIACQRKGEDLAPVISEMRSRAARTP